MCLVVQSKIVSSTAFLLLVNIDEFIVEQYPLNGVHRRYIRYDIYFVAMRAKKECAVSDMLLRQLFHFEGETTFHRRRASVKRFIATIT